MIVFSALLLLIGIFLSAFFSGSETGFYRVSRVRLVIQNLEGDRTARRLLWLVNNPGLFVATSLIGNNLANYLTSLAIVLLAGEVSDSSFAEMLAPVLMAPLLFVYGELMPKNLFFQAPNYFIRLAAPLFLFFTAVFVPASAILWSMSQLLQRLVGEAPERVQLTLARKELHQVLDDGIEAGIIRPIQRTLGQNFSLVASTPIRKFCTPVSQMVALPENSNPKKILKVASKKQVPDVVVYQKNRRQLIGYMRVVELLIERAQAQPVIHELPSVLATELSGETLLRMQTNRETILKVTESDGTLVGTLSIDQLTDLLLRGPLLALRR